MPSIAFSLINLITKTKKSRKKEEILEIGDENPKEMQVSGTGQTGI